MNPKFQRAGRNKNIKIQDMLSTGVGVVLVSKVEVSVDNRTIGRRKRKDDSDRSFRLRFSDTQQKRRQVSNSDFVETACRVRRERTPFHILLVSSKISVFVVSFWNSKNPKYECIPRCGESLQVLEWKRFRKGHWRVITWPKVVRMWLWERCNDCVEFFESPQNKTRGYVSQMTFGFFRWFLSFSSKSWTKWESANTERRTESGELVKKRIGEESLVPWK